MSAIKKTQAAIAEASIRHLTAHAERLERSTGWWFEDLPGFDGTKTARENHAAECRDTISRIDALLQASRQAKLAFALSDIEYVARVLRDEEPRLVDLLEKAVAAIREVQECAA